MKILQITTNQNMQSRPAATPLAPLNTNYLTQSAESDSVSFGSRHARLNSIFSRLRPNRMPDVPIDEKMFLDKLTRMNGDDFFQVFSPEGEVLKDQSIQEVIIPKNTLNAVSGNVVLMRTKYGIIFDHLIELMSNKAKAIFIYDNNLKKTQVFDFSSIQPSSMRQIRGYYSRHLLKIEEQQNMARIQAMIPCDYPSDMSAQPSFNDVLKQHGVRITEKSTR